MKTKKLFLLGLIAAALSLAGCEKDSDSNSNSNGGKDYQDDPNLSLVENLKNRAKPIAAKMLNKSESKVTFGDLEDEESEADVYYYNSSSLTFAVACSFDDGYNTGRADALESYLPSGAKLKSNEDDSSYADYGMMFYDRFYTVSDYTYDIYVEAYDEDDEYPAETDSYVFIYKTSQHNAFVSFITGE